MLYMHVTTHHQWENKCCPYSALGTGQLGVYTESSPAPIWVPFLLADFNLYHYLLIKCNCQYNGFSESFQQLTDPEDGPRTLVPIQHGLRAVLAPQGSRTSKGHAAAGVGSDMPGSSEHRMEAAQGTQAIEGAASLPIRSGCQLGCL